VIASQAVISGAFSLARQTIQLGLCPRMKIIHTSAKKIGQVYVPTINYLMLLGTISLVLFFRSSSNLAGAYGIAVSLTMLITTILFVVLLQQQGARKNLPVLIFAIVLLVPSALFFVANLTKLGAGGWVVILLAGAAYLLMLVWKEGRARLRNSILKESMPVDVFLKDVASFKPTRVPGIAAFLTGNLNSIPRSLLHNFKHNKIIHERILLITVETEERPFVAEEERASLKPLSEGFYQVHLRYGFSEEPHIPDALRRLFLDGQPLDASNISFFLGKESLIVTHQTGMPLWRKRLFAVMSQNAQDATKYFHLPPNRVLELGLQIEL